MRWLTLLLFFGLFGQSFYPNLRAEDGVVVEWKTLPGVRPSYKYNLGYTAVHEVGHWLGTFLCVPL